MSSQPPVKYVRRTGFWGSYVLYLILFAIPMALLTLPILAIGCLLEWIGDKAERLGYRVQDWSDSMANFAVRVKNKVLYKEVPLDK